MGFRLAQRANGVSELHGHVSRGMFNGLWPAFDEAEVPITSITNGVHGPTWIAREVIELAASRGADIDGDDTDALWPLVDQIGDREIWDLKRTLRTRFVDDARDRMRRSAPKRGFAPAETDVDRQRARPRRADHRLRAARADVQAPHADAARPRPPQEAAARPRAARSSWSSPARRTRPTRPASGSSRRWCASPTTRRSGTASPSCPTTTSRWRSRSTPAATCGSTTRCAPTRRAAPPA